MLSHRSLVVPLDFNPGDLFRNEIVEHRAAFEASARSLSESFVRTLAILRESLQRGGKIMLFGNGGSAADAQHLAAELVVRYQIDRPALAAIALTTDTSTLTACANDIGFDAIFERQIAGLGREPDVAMGISTSGKSANVIRGLRQAKTMGLKTVGLVGSGGEDWKMSCDAAIVIPSTITARIQEMHILVGHMLCKGLEQCLGRA